MHRPPASSQTAERFRAPLRCAWIVFIALLAGGAQAAPPAAPTLTFGILPIGGPAESREAWEPLLQDMSKSLGRPIHGISVSTYEGLAQAISEDRVDVCFLSGRLALHAVTQQAMQVIAQLVRTDGSKGYYSVLLTRRNGPIRDLDDMFAHPGKWRLARGESMSVSGYLVPETQLFARRGLDSDTFFSHVHIDNHENNALAVINGEADVATNNTADLERFRERFPDQYAHLRVIWTSALIPHAVIVVRSDLPAPLRAQIADFITHYGAGKSAEAARQRANLLLIHQIAGFAPADGRALLPFAEMEYRLELRRAQSAAWIDPAAKQARLQKIESDYKREQAQLEQH